MFLKSFIMVFVGLCAGVGVSAGTFAFLLVIKVIPRIIQKVKLEHRVIWMENVIISGIIVGTCFSLLEWKKSLLYSLVGKMFFMVFGLSAGMFVGCTAVALAEILDTFPIFYRRMHLSEKGTSKLLLCMAIGKMCGALFYFFMGYGLQGAG